MNNSMLKTAAVPLVLLGVSMILLWSVTPNVAIWLLLAELCWVSLYMLYVLLGASLDSLYTLVWGLFILGLATSESAVGLSILILNFLGTGSADGPRVVDNRVKPRR